MLDVADSLEISKELDQQNKMLDNVNTDFEEAIGGLDAVTKKTKELIKKSGESNEEQELWMIRFGSVMDIDPSTP